MFEPARHIRLSRKPWDEATARAAIAEIAQDAHERFDAARLWPAHPLDEGFHDGDTTLYAGAAGVVWGLDYLARTAAAPAGRDYRPVLAHLLAKNRADYQVFSPYPGQPSFLMGEAGVRLVAMRLAPSADMADALYRRLEDSVALEPLELMWGLPGAMLAALFMAEATGEARWPDLFRRQAARLLADLRDTPHGPLWVQELYGSVGAYLGPVHGFAGHMLALLRGWALLEEAQRERVAAATARTLCLTASESPHGVNWPALATESEPLLVQVCHGAPGIVTTFADAPGRTPELDRLLERAGDFIWHAGPLRKGAGLCHGTAGNGYALLKLYRRSGEARWLERARAFAMTAIGQYRNARRHYGRGRYSLWTGDLGLAIYLADCIGAQARFPTLDVFLHPAPED